MQQGSVSVRRRLFALSQLLFSLAILIGSSFEVVNLLVPSLIPQIQDMPLMRLHHSSRLTLRGIERSESQRSVVAKANYPPKV